MPSCSDGRRIIEGRVYRRIPAFETHFDYEAERPTFLAFQPRPADQGAASVLLADLVDANTARKNPRNPKDDTFGLCALDVARVGEATEGKVYFLFKGTKGELGHAHVQMFGCDVVEQAITVAQIAEVLIPPNPAR